MFEQITMADSARRSNPWSFAVSITVQSAIVAAALAMPLVRVAQLETRMPDILFLPRPLSPRVPVQQTARAIIAATQPGRTYRPFQAPTRIPTHVATGPDLPNAPQFLVGGPAGAGDSNGVVGIDLGFTQTIPLSVAPPEPVKKAAPPKPAEPATPVQVSSTIQAAKLVFGPTPAYPPLAKQARISGTVRLAAEISADGHIANLRVITGHPMLVKAALDAVGHWIYKPTLLNGRPVVVLTEIQVNFVLNQ
jgi:protein TonB